MPDRNCTIILVSSTAQVQMYSADEDTLARIFDMLGNFHDQAPLKVPPTNAELIQGAGVEHKIVADKRKRAAAKPKPKPKPDAPLPGVQYALTGGHGQPSIAAGNTWEESRVDPEPPKNGDSAFMASLANLMKD